MDVLRHCSCHIDNTQSVKRLSKQALLATLFVLACPLTAPAQVVQTPDTEEQRRRTQQEAQERLQQQQAPNVRLQEKAPQAQEALDTLALPVESPCFRVNTLRLEVLSQLPQTTKLRGASALPQDPFRFAQDYLEQYSGRCVGRDGLNLIVKRLTAKILDRGFTTTRIGIPQQDLGTGTLSLTLVPGIIRAIRFADPAMSGTWKTAFPARAGDILNLRDLEQGLEQMKRVPSQDVDMQIAPGELPGESDVIITVKREKPWKITANLDDSGTKATGKLQAGLSFALDNALGLNDLFHIGVSTDADRQGNQHGTGGNYSMYAIPWGYWTFTLAANTSRYYQQVAGLNQTFVSSGNTKNLEFKVQRLFYRDQTQKDTLQFKVGKRWSHAFIDDTEIDVQRRNVTFAELALLHKHYFGEAQLDLSFAYRRGVPWFHAQDNLPNLPAGSPDFFYAIETIDAALTAPFKIAGTPVRYIGAFRAQATPSALYGSEQFIIGNRYTVRGFDGDLTLAAERGFFLRNELEVPFGASGQAGYAGIDIGKVFGSSVQNLTGDKLAGAVLGLRGSPLKGAFYDVFVGWPLYKPPGFSSSPLAGFSLTYQY